MPQAPSDVIGVEEDQHEGRLNPLPKGFHVGDHLIQSPAPATGIGKSKMIDSISRVGLLLELAHGGILLRQKPSNGKGITQDKHTVLRSSKWLAPQSGHGKSVVNVSIALHMPGASVGPVHNQSGRSFDSPRTAEFLRGQPSNQDL
tara:strand:- start:226 stop:663 length:438 start_codon:yes stop_codon:yes gene_type:complete